MRKGFFPALAALFLAALLAGGGEAAAAPLKIVVGWVETPGHLAPLVAELAKEHPEIMPGNGKIYKFETIRFRGTTAEISALALNDLQIVPFSDAAFALAITNAHLDIKLVADVLQTGHKGYFPGEYVVAKAGPIKTIADVKGKRVATNVIGSAADTAMRVMLRRHGIKSSDFTTVEANFANQPAMLEEGKVDMIELLPQFAHDLMATGKYRVLFTAAQVMGVSETILWAMRADFIAAHRPALIAFFTDYIRAVHWFFDPKNRKAALAILAKVTHQPEKNLLFAFTKHDFYHDPYLVPNVAAVQREINTDVKYKVIKKGVVVSPKYVDLSLIEAAKKRLLGHGS